jgi:hypothetical protein
MHTLQNAAHCSKNCPAIAHYSSSVTKLLTKPHYNKTIIATIYRRKRKKTKTLKIPAIFGVRTPLKERIKNWEKERKAWEEKNKIAKESGFKTDWILKTAVICERPEVIVPEDPEWLKAYKQWRQKWDAPLIAQLPDINKIIEEFATLKSSGESEAAASSASTTEKKTAEQKDKKRDQKQKQEKSEADDLKELEEVLQEKERRARELQKEHEEKEQIQYGSRITEADLKNDMRSLYRKLDRKLFLIVKKDRPQYAWQFPQRAWREGETLRDTAIRAATEDIGDKIHLHFPSNGPVGVYSYPLPQDMQKQLDAYGVKVFFFYAFYVKGPVILNTRLLCDHLWVTKEEMAQYFDADSFNFLTKIIPDTFIVPRVTRVRPTVPKPPRPPPPPPPNKPNILSQIKK